MDKLNFKHKRIIAAAMLLAMSALACGLNLKNPITKIETGPLQTVDLQIPMPAEGDVALNLEFAAGDLKLAPAKGSASSSNLVSGKAVFNVPDLEPFIETDGSVYTIRSGEMEIEGFPVPDKDWKNEWDLQLAQVPLSLKIQAGAYQGSLELGGLALQRLEISEGGSDLNLTFSAPNTERMTELIFSTGGSRAVLSGLGNANFERMKMDAGAGEYTLVFDGELRMDALVEIDAGVGTLTIIVPAGVNAEAVVDSGLSSADAGEGWTKTGTGYTHAGSGPTISFKITMGVGTLNLKSE